MASTTIYARVSTDVRTALDAYTVRTGMTIAHAVNFLLAHALEPADIPGTLVCASCASRCGDRRMPLRQYASDNTVREEIGSVRMLQETIVNGWKVRDVSGAVYEPIPVTTVRGTLLCAAHAYDAANEPQTTRRL